MTSIPTQIGPYTIDRELGRGGMGVVFLGHDTRGEEHEDIEECARALVALYTAWHAAEPDSGHDAKAAEWRERFAETDAASGASMAEDG
jgi:serine/threonine protein kinase